MPLVSLPAATVGVAVRAEVCAHAVPPPQQPLAFANAEQRPSVAVHFPCTAAAPLFIFWNAEYVPGSFAFEVSDA